jgi:hypothetical protein
MAQNFNFLLMRSMGYWTMIHKLADFLEANLPLAMILFVLLSTSVIVVYAFDSKLALAGVSEVATMLVIYGPPHDRLLKAQWPT